MLEVVALLSIIGAVILLLVLSVIDLRTRLLPNELVAGFALSGVIFHLTTLNEFASWYEMAVGAAIGSGILYAIRFVSNRLYKQDTLGLGDVKLMGAAGLWLGSHYILPALVVGSLAGVVHGLGVALYIWMRTKSFPSMKHLSLPAGPGFAIGIVIVGIFEFWIF